VTLQILTQEIQNIRTLISVLCWLAQIYLG